MSTAAPVTSILGFEFGQAEGRYRVVSGLVVPIPIRTSARAYFDAMRNLDAARRAYAASQLGWWARKDDAEFRAETKALQAVAAEAEEAKWMADAAVRNAILGYYRWACVIEADWYVYLAEGFTYERHLVQAGRVDGIVQCRLCAGTGRHDYLLPGHRWEESACPHCWGKGERAAELPSFIRNATV